MAARRRNERHSELISFAAGVRGLWSQGMVEGFKNKIKRLKRIMSGRRGYDLLCPDMLHTHAA